VTGRKELDLTGEEVVHAAIEIFEAEGLEAVSMRTVAARLGVSPVPVYRRVGNKEALLDAMADHLLTDVVPAFKPTQGWREYAIEWATALRDRLGGTTDAWLLIGGRRSAYVEASKPLVEALQAGGFAEDAAVQACRLLIWAVAGFVVVETRRPKAAPRPRKTSRPGGSPHGISDEEADQLFMLHLRVLVGGLDPDEQQA
jgi:TetR/AcrR family transcriptional regulator, tetracycline repressor protein